MSVGPLGLLGNIASLPLAQTKGADVDRTRTDTANRARESAADELAENAAGLGRTEGEQEAGDRDADGRKLWEEPLGKKATSDADAAEDSRTPTLSKDATGSAGRNLDLSG